MTPFRSKHLEPRHAAHPAIGRRPAPVTCPQRARMADANVRANPMEPISEADLPKLNDRLKRVRAMRGALLLAGAIAAAPTLAAPPPVDADAARALAKKGDCFKCHTVDEKKDGPAYREVAKKWRAKADAEQKLYTHVTTSPKVKIDGEEENHQMVKSKNDAEIYNLIRFILSLPNP